MDWREFLSTAEERFGLQIRHYKSKAGHEMIELWLEGQHFCNGSISGPDAGHTVQYPFWTISICGWTYALMQGKWYLFRDGAFSWRQGPNPFPEIPESPTDDMS